MSNETKRKLEVWVPIVLALISILYSALLLPYRMSAAEAEIRQIKSEKATDHDMLWEIRGRTLEIQAGIDRIERRK